MKITYNCANCGELLTVTAGEVKSNGDALFYVHPHDCFPEIDHGEPTGRPWGAWPAPVREITSGGLDGTVLNTCMLCGEDAIHTGRCWVDKYDLFKCSSEHCQVEFNETGTGPELLPYTFRKDVEYKIKLYNGDTFEFIVTSRDNARLTIAVNDCSDEVNVDIVKNGDSEFFVVPLHLGGQEETVYPYCSKP